MKLTLPSRRLSLAIVVMMSVAMYRPFVLWSHNPWDLAAPHELFLFGVAVLVMQIAIFHALVSFGILRLRCIRGRIGIRPFLLEEYPGDVALGMARPVRRDGRGSPWLGRPRWLNGVGMVGYGGKP